MADAATPTAQPSAAHTPGPWSAVSGDRTGFKTLSGGASIIANARPTDDYFVLKVAELDTNVPEAEREANARLIAAAPDLLAALKALQLQALQSPDLLKTEWGMQALDATRAAISKATGEA